MTDRPVVFSEIASGLSGKGVIHSQSQDIGNGTRISLARATEDIMGIDRRSVKGDCEKKFHRIYENRKKA